MRALRIDLNSDVGESYGPWSMGRDEELIPLVTSVNVACGFHAGDPLTIARTVQHAHESGTAIGAHPGYPDLVGFGRRDLDMRRDELEAALLYQIAALDGFCRAAGTRLGHVKPHGALYNRAARDPATAEAVARGVRGYSAELILVGLAGSVAIEAGRAAGLGVASEAFADRLYEPDGTLRSRRHDDAVHLDPADAARQAVSIVRDRCVTASDGRTIALEADTLCIHGDTPGAAEIARQVRGVLAQAGVELRPLVRAAAGG